MPKCWIQGRHYIKESAVKDYNSGNSSALNSKKGNFTTYFLVVFSFIIVTCHCEAQSAEAISREDMRLLTATPSARSFGFARNDMIKWLRMTMEYNKSKLIREVS